MTREEADFIGGMNMCDEISNEAYKKIMCHCEEQEPCEDAISRKSIKQKLREHHDFFVNAYGGFSNLSQNDKSRIDEIINCIAMVVNEPPVTPQPDTARIIVGKSRGGMTLWYQCEKCNEPIDDQDTFCRGCGRRLVK